MNEETTATKEKAPLIDYMANNSTRASRSAAFLRTYAARVRDGSAKSWEIPNTVAQTLEDIALFIEAGAGETSDD